MNTVTIIEDPFSSEREIHETDNLLEFLAKRFTAWPDNARLYHSFVSADHDVTPRDEAGVEKLRGLRGDFFVVFFPQGADPLTPIIVGVVLAVAAVGAAFVFTQKPKVPSVAPNSAARNVQSVSPNNELSARTNKARPGGRIPDIFGTVRSTPDLIVAPYSDYVNNREVEHSVLCIGRGRYEIHDMYDGETDCRYIPDTSIQVYHPHTDIIADEPCHTVGPRIATDPMLSVRSNSVNGQKLEAPDPRTFSGGNNIVFIAPDEVRLTGAAENTLADMFRSGDDIIISNSASGANTVNLNGAYRMLSVANNSLFLDDPASVNAGWESIGTTGASSASLASTGEHWVGPFILEDAGRGEVWCNFVALNGLYKDDGKDQYAVSVNILTEITPVDRDNKPVGDTERFNLALAGSASERSTVARTLKAATAAQGRCLVRARRTSATDKTFEGSVVDEVQWKDLYAMAELPWTNFGNVTLVRSATVATAGALALKERKLNCLVTRQIPARSEEGGFTGELHSTTNMADIFCAVCLDPYIGNRELSELDVDNIYDTAAEVRDYFGTGLLTDFCYTLDNGNTSFEETAGMVAGAGFCTAYRSGSVIRFFFERATDLSTLLFNHRNKLPGTETRSIAFGLSNDNDGLEFEYVSPEDDAVITLHLPEDQSAVNPAKIESVGIRNEVQARMHAWRAWNKMRFRRLSCEFEATQEAELLIPGERILVTDNIGAARIDGQVESQDGLEVFTSQILDALEGEYTDMWGVARRKEYACFLQLCDGTVQAVSVFRGNHRNSFILKQPPPLPLVVDDGAYAKTLFSITEDAGGADMAFLVEEKSAKSNFTVGLTAVNYDARYYERDKDYIKGLITYTGA